MFQDVLSGRVDLHCGHAVWRLGGDDNRDLLFLQRLQDVAETIAEVPRAKRTYNKATDAIIYQLAKDLGVHAREFRKRDDVGVEIGFASKRLLVLGDAIILARE